MSWQPDFMHADTPKSDNAVRFYAEWRDVRYPIGEVQRKPRRGTLVQHPTAERMQLDSMPFGRVLFEVEFQPLLYRNEDDDSDMPMREKLYVRGRTLPPSDYIVLTDEKLHDISQEQ